MAEQLLQSVTNSLTVLEILAESETELGVSDISRRLGISTSSAYRLLLTLEAKVCGSEPPYGKISAGNGRFVPLDLLILNNTNIIMECHPLFLQELNQLTGETSLLAIYTQGEITYVDKITGSNNPAEFTSLIGVKRPAYSTANGKILLAFLPQDELNTYLDHVELRPLTPYTITDKAKLVQTLKEIRISKLAEDNQEAQEGLVCFGAPIRNAYG
jgi:DNA-binding IclR family transcriptional regulator